MKMDDSAQTDVALMQAEEAELGERAGLPDLNVTKDSEMIIRRFQMPPKDHAKSSLSYGQAEAGATLLALATVLGAGLWCMREERRFLEDCEDAEAVLDTELLPVSPPARVSGRGLALSSHRRAVAAGCAL